MSGFEDDEPLPPPPAVEVISYTDIDAQMGAFVRSVELNERLLHRLQDYELMLLEASSLPAMLDVLLNAAPEHFSLSSVRLVLHDPGRELSELMIDDLDYGAALVLQEDSFGIQQLYGAQPEVELLGAGDKRLQQAFPNSPNVSSGLLLPLLRDGRIMGSLQWGDLRDDVVNAGAEMDFIAHLAAIISICLENCINAERLSQLSLLDPLTRLSNERAFGMELRKEISRAQRNQKPLSLMLLKVDDFKDINEHYGHLSGDFALKAVARLVAAMLRTTDLVARCHGDLFAVLLPACSEVKAQDIAGRMRSEAEFMEIDDRRGASLFASLSLGLTNWNPQSYPAVNMEQLSQQMRAAARQALDRAREAGGNRVVVTRLTTMIV